MIMHFPHPYPGELLYSVFARFAEHMRYPTVGAAMLELFGTRNSVPSIELPNGVADLLSKLPPGHGYDADLLINKHTLFPLYAPFLRQGNFRKVYANMVGSGARVTQTVAGINAGRVPPPRTFRSCPRCDHDSLQEFGETYWHRVHQVSGVEVCPLHALFLQESNALRPQRDRRHSFSSAQGAVRRASIVPVNETIRSELVLLKVAKLVAEILDFCPTPDYRCDLREHYLRVLNEMGLTRKNGGICARAVRSQFLEFCPAEILSTLRCELPQSTTASGWLQSLVQAKQQTIAPIRHLLFIAWLDKPLQTIIGPEKVRDPLVEKFPCLNSICDWFEKQVTNRIEFRRSKRFRTVRVYRCPYCSHASTRRSNCDEVVRVVDFGNAWSDKLRLLWTNRKVSLTEMRSILGADKLTIRRHAAILGLRFPREFQSARPTVRPEVLRLELPSASLRNAKRARWQSLKGPGCIKDRTKTRHLYFRLYRWLRKFDRDWLKANSLRGNCRLGRRKERVDWSHRDQSLLLRLPQAVETIKASPRPRRLSRTRLGHELGMLAAMEAHPEKFPNTLGAIAKVVENREQFALRRLENTVEHFITVGLVPKWSELIRRAGINTRFCQEPLIRVAVENALRRIEATIRSHQIRERAA